MTVMSKALMDFKAYTRHIDEHVNALENGARTVNRWEVNYREEVESLKNKRYKGRKTFQVAQDVLYRLVKDERGPRVRDGIVIPEPFRRYDGSRNNRSLWSSP